MPKNYDFAGWATRNNIVCSDGRIIMRDAFKDCDGSSVPVIWNHQHDDVQHVLGHAVLENREEGVYAYGYLNNTPSGKAARLVLDNDDVFALSIYANKLKQNGPNVIHGAIREVSLVLAGANPGAYIESVIRHGEEDEEEAYIRFVDESSSVVHGEKKEDKESEKKEEQPMAKDTKADEHDGQDENGTGSGKTIGDIFESMNEEQKTVVYALVGQALKSKGKGADDEEDDEDQEEENKKMKHNAFSDSYTEEDDTNTLTHAEMEAIASDAQRLGSMREAFIQHGINQIDMLFPDAKNVGPNEPIFVQRDMTWVSSVMGSVKHSGFSRIKSMFANITGEEARARGYIKGDRKEEEVFSLLSRVTTPQTVYKLQEFDRDDIIDITDLDVIAWVKKEMRMMLDEELARAFLVGDGRSAISKDKIKEDNIRSIYHDDEFFSIKYPIVVSASATRAAKAEAFIDETVRSRKLYKGSGNPTMFMTEDLLTDCLLLKDTNKHRLYKTVEELATALRVSKIVTVPVMEGLTRNANGRVMELAAIYVNLSDYNVGADKGGSVNLFDDFDIHFNKYEYLIETRCSGALVKPFSAVVLEFGEGAPLKLGCAPESRDAVLLGKSVRDLQTHVTVFEDKIAGQLNYVEGYTGFSGDTDEQSGNYLALKFTAASDATTTVQKSDSATATTLDSDMNCVFRITPNTKYITVVTSRSGESLTKVYDLSGLTLKSA